MELLYGKSVCLEALKAKHKARRLYYDFKSEKDKTVSEIISLAKKQNVRVEKVDSRRLNELTKQLHQGVVLEVEDYKYYTLEEVLKETKKELPLFVMLDGLEDPHNLGAILRTCDASGVDCVIVPKNRSVKLNSTVAKVSTGAIEHVKVVEVVNLNQAIEKLKQAGFWICTLEKEEGSVRYDSLKYDFKTCLVVGSEGFGVKRLVKQNSDYIIEIPMVGHVNSLNASVSCAILIYEIMKNRI